MRIIEFTLNSNATVTSQEFGVIAGQQVHIEVNISATGSPTGTQTLQRKKNNGWSDESLDVETFTDPSTGASNSELNLTNLPPGAYRYRYASTSGGTTDGITGVIRMSLKR